MMYPKEVMEIHSAFNNAGDEILQKAMESVVKVEPKKSIKVELLKKFGFTQTNEVKDYEIIEHKAKLDKQLIDIIHQYKVKYPLNRFITDEQVDAICTKWNLVQGDVSRYKGFVPEKNLRDIEKFTERHIPKGAIFLDNMVIEGYEVKLKGSRYHLFKLGTNDKYLLQSDEGIEFYGTLNNVKDLEYHSKLINKIKSEVSPASLRRNDTFIMGAMVKTTPFKICAPIKDMDTSGMRLINNKLVHIPDPVVLFPVELGYIIVTAWGDEASDENVVNADLN